MIARMNMFLSKMMTVVSDNGVNVGEEVISASENTVSGNSVSENVIAEIAGELTENLNAFQRFMKKAPETLLAFAIKAAIVLALFFVGSRLIKLVRFLLKKSLNKAGVEKGISQFFDSFVKVVLYVLLIIGIASYFGFQTTSLVAIVGSAGVTIALALQGSLSNFTGGVLILLLKPFKVGDYIKEDNKGNEGTVVEIHMFFTKLCTVDDRIVILPNGSLANTSLTNYSLSPNRRIMLKVGISYGSDIKLAKKIIKKAMESDDRILKNEPIQVFVDGLDESQVTIGYRCVVENVHYWEVSWGLQEHIKEALEEAGIEIPFNQLDVHVDNK